MALRCVGRHGEVTDYSYLGLREQTNRFANLLRGLGAGKGDRVFSLLGRVPELYVAALGTLKNASVFCPLFSAFGPEPIRDRMLLGDAQVLVTSPQLYERKIAPIRAELPGLKHVLVAGAGPVPPGTIALGPALAAAVGGVRHTADRSRGHGAAAFHQRHDRQAEGRRARARGGRGAPRDAPRSRWTCGPGTCSGAPPTPAG